MVEAGWGSVATGWVIAIIADGATPGSDMVVIDTWGLVPVGDPDFIRRTMASDSACRSLATVGATACTAVLPDGGASPISPAVTISHTPTTMVILSTVMDLADTMTTLTEPLPVWTPVY